MRHPSRHAPRAGALRLAHRPRILRVAIVAGAVAVAACAAPPADEPATTAEAPAPVSAAAPATVPVDAASVADTVSMTVYKEPTCGCCTKWVEHIEQHGIRVDARDVADVSVVKDELGMPRQLGSCHTAVIGGYIVEGHVPADIIMRMLRERPAIVGIAVPGMPMGSPGMEGDGTRRDRYDVIAIGRDGRTSVYATR